MKKILILGMGCMMLPMVVVIVFFFATGGGTGSSGLPLTIFATPKQAYQYQYIASELGVPWDITILADGIHAYENGEPDVANYDPLMTALQFCILEEQIYEAVIEEPEESDDTDEQLSGDGEGGELQDGQPAEGQEDPSSSRAEPVVTWVLRETKFYTGFEEILGYMEMDSSSFKFAYGDVNELLTILDEIAQEKTDDSNGEYKYEVTLLNNPDYERVLRELIVLNEKDISYVMEVYESKYLCLLYGYDSVDFTELEIELPELVVGNVTREQLAQVAVSLIGHPYWLGGKSSHEGPPDGPLDCSGYVDWVYMQCFGVTVGNGGGGKIPSGIAVSGTGIQWYACDPIDKEDLQIGDLGFLRDPAEVKSGQYNHVGIYLGNGYWIHCGGSSYGTDASPTGRVGISVSSGSNSYNPVDGTSFSPAMKSVKFNYFRRPRFEFIE